MKNQKRTISAAKTDPGLKMTSNEDAKNPDEKIVYKAAENRDAAIPPIRSNS